MILHNFVGRLDGRFCHLINRPEGLLRQIVSVMPITHIIFVQQDFCSAES